MNLERDTIERIENAGSTFSLVSNHNGAYAEVRNHKGEVLFWADGDDFGDVIKRIDLGIREKESNK